MIVSDNNLTSSHSIESPTQILVIDDDEDILNLFSDFLKKEGYGVTSFLDPLKRLLKKYIEDHKDTR